jgi:hypothetical protein
MVFFQITVDSNDPPALARFWGAALGYTSSPPAQPDTPWHRHYRERLGDADGFDNRIFDPEGLRPPFWFQQVPEGKTGKNRVHFDLYPTGRDNALTQAERVEIVDARVAELVDLGAIVVRADRDDDPDNPYYYVVMQDPEGNEFCVS